MRLLVLGGTLFLGRHVVTAALARGHEVATFTRGVSGEPPPGVRALHGDRDDPAALPRALGDWRPDAVVDTSCQTRAAARNAAAALTGVGHYAFVSSLSAYAHWPPGPVGPEDGEPTHTSDADEYGAIKADAERLLGGVLGERFLTARAGLIVGPYDPIHRLGWWLQRIARGGRVVVPDALAQPIAAVDARDLAGWLVDVVERRVPGAVNATGPAGMTTLGGLLETCRAVTGSDAEWVPVPEADLLAAGVEPWQHLPLWLPADVARTAWDVDTGRARALGLPSRPLADSVADTWAWLRDLDRLPPSPPGRPRPGLPEDLETRLLGCTGGFLGPLAGRAERFAAGWTPPTGPGPGDDFRERSRSQASEGPRRLGGWRGEDHIGRRHDDRVRPVGRRRRGGRDRRRGVQRPGNLGRARAGAGR